MGVQRAGRVLNRISSKLNAVNASIHKNEKPWSKHAYERCREPPKTPQKAGRVSMTGHHWPSKGAPGQRGDHGCSKPEERLGGVWPGPEERGVRARPASAQTPEGSGFLSRLQGTDGTSVLPAALQQFVDFISTASVPFCLAFKTPKPAPPGGIRSPQRFLHRGLRGILLCLRE